MVDQQTQEVALASWDDGRELRRLPTESANSSGLAFDGTNLWVACNGMSTGSAGTAEYSDGSNKAVLKVDSRRGRTLARHPIPLDPESGVHGLEWVNGSTSFDSAQDGSLTTGGTVWVTALRARRVAQVRDDDWTLVRSIPFERARAHGLAWDHGYLWCVETNDRAIYKLDGVDGCIVETIPIPEPHPEPHGLTIFRGTLWYCDANTGEVCRIERAD